MEHPRGREGVKTAAQQIGAYKLLSENKPTAYDEALLLSMIEEAERRAEQRVRAEISKRDTWFYMVGDPESGHADMADMLSGTNPFEIVETSEAADIRIFFAYQDDDGEIYEFSTLEEAELAVNKAIDAAREVG